MREKRFANSSINVNIKELFTSILLFKALTSNNAHENILAVRRTLKPHKNRLPIKEFAAIVIMIYLRKMCA